MASITAAAPGDIGAIAVLLEEMDRFYGATESEPLELQLNQISDALFGDPPAAHALLAWDGDALAGIAAYSYLWPAVGLTRSMYLKELYVSTSRRRLGIGAQLMRSLVDVAAKHRCSRVEWTTDADNTAAQSFYATLGYETCGTKIFYREERQIHLSQEV